MRRQERRLRRLLGYNDYRPGERARGIGHRHAGERRSTATRARVKSDGSVACWGDNYYGQASVPAGLGTVTQVSAGGLHTCAVKSDGSVACWGFNGQGQVERAGGIGRRHTGERRSKPHTARLSRVTAPSPAGATTTDGQASVPAGLGTVTQVSAGRLHTCAVKSDGSVVCWGQAAEGTLIAGSFVDVAPGGDHACALESGGSVTCWGNNSHGQASVPAGLGTVTQVSAGAGHTCAVKSNGSVACWGYNSQGQASVPAGLGAATQVSAGAYHTCAIKSDGSVACWGYNCRWPDERAGGIGHRHTGERRGIPHLRRQERRFRRMLGLQRPMAKRACRRDWEPSRR